MRTWKNACTSQLHRLDTIYARHNPQDAGNSLIVGCGTFDLHIREVISAKFSKTAIREI